jgi:hypothetical protein
LCEDVIASRDARVNICSLDLTTQVLHCTCRYIEAAQPFPISGLFRFQDFYEEVMAYYDERNPFDQGVSTGWPCLDDVYKVWLIHDARIVDSSSVMWKARYGMQLLNQGVASRWTALTKRPGLKDPNRARAGPEQSSQEL